MSGGAASIALALSVAGVAACCPEPRCPAPVEPVSASLPLPRTVHLNVTDPSLYAFLRGDVVAASVSTTSWRWPERLNDCQGSHPEDCFVRLRTGDPKDQDVLRLITQSERPACLGVGLADAILWVRPVCTLASGAPRSEMSCTVHLIGVASPGSDREARLVNMQNPGPYASCVNELEHVRWQAVLELRQRINVN